MSYNFYFDLVSERDYSNNNLSFKPKNISAEATIGTSFSAPVFNGDALAGYRFFFPEKFIGLQSNFSLQSMVKGGTPVNLVIDRAFSLNNNLIFINYVGTDEPSTGTSPVNPVKPERTLLPVWIDSGVDVGTETNEKQHRFKQQMAVAFKFTKQPIEVQDIAIDFTGYLESYSDKILTFRVDQDEGILLSDVRQAGSMIYMVVSGGTDNAMYKISVTISTVGGRIKQSELLVRVFER